MKEIPLSQGRVALVDDEDYEWLNQWKWTYSDSGYARRNIYIDGKVINTYMHRVIMNPPEDKQIDHINFNGLDNQRTNMRICTLSQNLSNRPAPKINKSGYKGVCWNKNNRKWSAEITFMGRHIHLGLFVNIEDAASAYNDKARELFGEFAYRN